MHRQANGSEIDRAGFVSLAAAAGSILTFVGLVLYRVIGFPVSRDVAGEFISVYALLLMLALGTGFASRHTRFGRWGLRLAAFWLLFMVLAAGVALFVRR